VRRHSDADREKKKRCDDHPDSDRSEPATGSTFGFFQMGDRNILDKEGNYIAAGGQHYPDPKAHEGVLESRKVPR
jgi:hypothetical protein